MRRAFLKISSIAIWVAVAAIWSHMIIPHDHHISDTFSDQEKNCPAAHQQGNDKPEFPVHCHAFNDLASEEARVYHFSQNIAHVFVAHLILPDDIIAMSQSSCSRIIEFQTLIKSSSFQITLLLRAPPSLA